MDDSPLIRRTRQIQPPAAPGSEPPIPPNEDLATRQIAGKLPSPDLDTRQIAGKLPSPGPDARRTESERLLRIDGQLPPDTVLQNRYRVIETIGVGGMSTVYRAQDLHFPRVERICAIKEMLNTASDPKVREMVVRNFEREAGILATLNHPAITQIYDFFSFGDRSYLVLEFVQGKDLETVLNDSKGFLSEEQVVAWAVQVCDVLIYLHQHKPSPIIFRDLKPSNLMLDEQGRIRLVDFGIAKVFQSGQKGTMIGTEGYSPPEQYRGVAEPRGDIYALGATLHHLLSKQDPRLEPPFSFHERPIHKSNPTVSQELQEIVNRSLEYDVNRRYGSAEEMKRVLMGLRAARGIAVAASAVAAVDKAALQTVWQFACEDEVRSSPAHWEGLVYVGAYDNNLYALEAETGKFAWKYPAEGGIASSPTIEDGKVFFGSVDRLVYAVNARTGRIAWTCPTKARVYSSPSARFGHVFIGSDDNLLYAINALNGRVAWNFSAEGPVRGRPAIGSDAVYFGDEAGSVYAVGVNSQLQWRFRARRGITSSPLLTSELVCVGSQDMHLYALDVRSGWAIWKYRTSGAIISSPALSGSAVYFGSTDGYVYALDAADGYLVWRYKTNDQVTSSPAVHGGAVYIGSADGLIYSLDAQTGQLRWQYQTNGPVVSSPLVVGDLVIVGSLDHRVYALPL